MRYKVSWKNGEPFLCPKTIEQAHERGVDISLLITTVALNNVYGFGRERLVRLQEEFNKLINEYADKVMDSEGHANDVLTKRVNDIMRK